MKKSTLKILLIVLVIIFVIICIALGMKKWKKVENTTEEVKNIIEQVEEQADKDTENVDEISEVNINQAIDFIEANMQIPIEDVDEEVAQDIAYYGSYLKQLGEKYTPGEDNEIVILGENALEYAKEISGKSVDELLEEKEQVEKSKEIINDIEVERTTRYDELKNKVSESLQKIDENKEELIKEFSAAIKTDETIEE